MTVPHPDAGKKTLTTSLLAFAFSVTFAIHAVAQIATGTTGIDATGNEASEMAACNRGATPQSKETCMTEVRNANAAKRAGKVDNSGAPYSSNALMRCNAFQGEDKLACEARVTGLGQPQGSVGGGGVITQIETVVVPATPPVTTNPPAIPSDTVIVTPAK